MCIRGGGSFTSIRVAGCFLRIWQAGGIVHSSCRLQAADCRPQAAGCRLLHSPIAHPSVNVEVSVGKSLAMLSDAMGGGVVAGDVGEHL